MDKFQNSPAKKTVNVKLSSVQALYGLIPSRNSTQATLACSELLVATSSMDIIFSVADDFRQMYRHARLTAAPIVGVSWSYDNTMALYHEENGLPQIVSTDGVFRHLRSICILDNNASAGMCCAQFSRTSNATIALGTNCNLTIYDTRKKCTVEEFPMPASVVSLDFNCGDTYVVVACVNGDVCLVDLGIPMPRTHCSLAPAQPTRVRCHHYASHIFGVTTSKGFCGIYNMRRCLPLFFARVTGSRRALTDLAFNPSGRGSEVATVDASGNVCIFDYRSGERLLRCATGIPAYSIDYHLNGKELAVGLADGTIIVLLTTPPYKPKLRTKKHNGPIFCLRYANACRNCQSVDEALRKVGLTRETAMICNEPQRLCPITKILPTGHRLVLHNPKPKPSSCRQLRGGNSKKHKEPMKMHSTRNDSGSKTCNTWSYGAAGDSLSTCGSNDRCPQCKRMLNYDTIRIDLGNRSYFLNVSQLEQIRADVICDLQRTGLHMKSAWLTENYVREFVERQFALFGRELYHECTTRRHPASI